MIEKIEKLKISVLAKDLSFANEVAHELRAFNIIPSIFINLDSFLLGFEDNDFDLNIIASDCLTQGSLSLKNYSSYTAGKMKVALFYNEDPHSLLKSYGINNYGLIRLGVGLRSQLQSVMGLIIKEQDLEENAQSFKRELRSLSNKNLRLERENIALSQKVNSIDEFMRIVNRVQKGSDFLSSLNDELKNWSKCREFSLLSFDKKTSKLFSLKVEGPKYKNLPAMSIDEVSIFRSDFLQMLEEAFKEQFSSGIKALNLGGVILIGHFDHELSSPESWSFLESSLKSLNRENLEFPLLGNDHNFSKFLQKIDDDYFNLQKHGAKFLTIDMTNLIMLISKKYNSRFYWDSFMSHFKAQFEKNNIIKSLTLSGVTHVYVECDALDVKEVYDLLKTKVMEFKYWDFFEDSSLSFSQKDYPTINLTPSSAVGVLRSEESTLKVNLSKQRINLN